MGRAVLLIVAIEFGGGWLLASTFGFEPVLAYAVMAVVLAILVAIFILLKARSLSD